MYGGAIYDTALREIFGEETVKTLPYERIINSNTWSFLNDEGSFDITYKNSFAKSAYAIKRFNLERWMIDIAKREGVYYIPDTLVIDLIEDNGYIVGVETEQEKYYSRVVILADGVNSFFAQRLGLREEFKPKDMILSAKETLKLDRKTIEERFNLKSDLTNGVCKMYFGGLKNIKNIFMMTYLYTFKDTVMLGVGASLEDLKKNKLNINTVLDEIKEHPDIACLIKDASSVEYSAHLIPETGYKKMPKLTANGVIIAGDAAGFINSVHFEGTNYALISGKLAGETASGAIDDYDCSGSNLSIYRKKLEKSFILKDLYSYRNVIDSLSKRSSSLSYYYPKKIKEFFEIIVSANCVSKSSQIRKFVLSFTKDRNIFELLKDIKTFVKCGLDVLFGK
jgi:electron transfer flavoprotein-quinone oxidoreductase